MSAEYLCRNSNAFRLCVCVCVCLPEREKWFPWWAVTDGQGVARLVLRATWEVRGHRIHARLSSHSTGANSSNSRYKSPGKKRLRRLPNGNESRLHLQTREGCRHSIQLFCCIALKSQICQFCLNNLFTPDVPAPGPPMRLQRTRRTVPPSCTPLERSEI